MPLLERAPNGGSADIATWCTRPRHPSYGMPDGHTVVLGSTGFFVATFAYTLEAIDPAPDPTERGGIK